MTLQEIREYCESDKFRQKMAIDFILALTLTDGMDSDPRIKRQREFLRSKLNELVKKK